MKKLFIILVGISIVLFSCEPSKKQRVAKGDRTYGGTLKIITAEQFHTLYPPSIIDIVSSRIARQIYSTLVKYNMRDLSIEPDLAEKWEVDEQGLVYTFHLKKGVLFHDDPCFHRGNSRELTVNDVKYSFTLLCTYSPDNHQFANTFKDRLLGATKYYEASKQGKPSFEVEGIKIPNDSTIQLILEKPCISFLYILGMPATSIVPQEAIEKYGKDIKVGSGPFIANTIKQDTFMLVRNENYYGYDTLGNQLPNVDTLLFISSIKEAVEKINQFKAGKIDIVSDLYTAIIIEVVKENIADFEGEDAKYIVESAHDMNTYFVNFNMNKDIFKNQNVRKAINYAIDRKKIAEKILKIEDYAGIGIYGITPLPAFKNYQKIVGYDVDIKKAKDFLAKAGYLDGKNFPKINLLINNRDKENTIIAEEIRTQLKNNLNINVEFNSVPLSVQVDSAKFSKYDLLLTTWNADYPSPENFLLLFYGKNVPESIQEPSFPNFARYKNAQYDELFELGMYAKTKEDSYNCFAEAEQILMNDAALIPIWYSENFRLLQVKVKGFYFNPMKYVDYSLVYIKEKPKQMETAESEK